MSTATAARRTTAFDLETRPIKTLDIAPKVICSSFAFEFQGDVHAMVLGNGDPELKPAIEKVLSDNIAVTHNGAAYDLTCVVNMWPDLFPLVWRSLLEARIRDTQIREILLNLGTHGKLDFMTLPDGTTKLKIGLKLTDLEKKYLGKDRSDQKGSKLAKTPKPLVRSKVEDDDGDEGEDEPENAEADKEILEEDIWRKHYALLDGYKAKDYPDDAANYVKDDSLGALGVYYAQERKRDAIKTTGGYDVFQTEPLQCAAAFALRLMSVGGVHIDHTARKKIIKWLKKELDPAKHKLIYKTGEPDDQGIVRPAEPSRPYANGACHPDGTPKMTNPVKESADTGMLKAHILHLCQKHGRPVLLTKASKRFPIREGFPDGGQVKTSKEVIGTLSPLSALLRQYEHRQSLQKLVSTELPRLLDIDGSEPSVAHPVFKILVETGRTSSYASGLFASMNIQNVDPRVRGCYVPGTLPDAQGAPRKCVILSVDVKALELVSAAQKCYSLLGYSHLRDVINAGTDPHEWLGARIAFRLSDEFRAMCDSRPHATTKDEVFAVFHKLKTSSNNEHVTLWKHYRKFAKPTGLGYPGGLGPETFMAFAKASYDVVVDLETAILLREEWLETYPEFRDYFRWVNNDCVEPDSPPPPDSRYWYDSPLGMRRRRATYCATVNGAALQTPSAEAAKLAVIDVMRACTDPTRGSILYGHFRPWAFVHDEILGDLAYDEFTHERAMEVGRLMRGALQVIFPDMLVQTQPCIMHRWHKSAEPVFINNRLQVWEPSRDKKGEFFGWEDEVL